MACRRPPSPRLRRASPASPRRRTAVARLVPRLVARPRLLHRQRHGEGRRRARNLDGLPLEHAQHLGLRARPRILRREHVGRRPLDRRLLDGALALQVEVLQEELVVVGEVRQRRQQPGLGVVVVVALRPHGLRQRRILLVPRAGIVVGLELALHRVRAAVAERLVEPADAVVHRADEHQVARRPCVEGAVGKGAGHAELRHLRHVVPAEQLPLVGEDRVHPRVVGPVADGVVVEVRHRLVQVVQHLHFLRDHEVDDVAGKRQRGGHRVAVVVVDHVLAPVDGRGPGVFRVRQVPLVDVDLPIAAVGFQDRRDHRDDVRADRLDVGALVDRQPVGQFHQGRRRTGLGRVERPGDVIHRHRQIHQAIGLRLVELDGAGIGQLREARPVLVEFRQDRLGGNRHRDHLAALLGLPDREHLHAARARLLEHPHVLVHFGRVGQLARRARDVAQDGLRRRHRLRRRQVVHQGRQEERLGGVFPDLLCVVLVDELFRIAGVLVRLGQHAGAGGAGQQDQHQGAVDGRTLHRSPSFPAVSAVGFSHSHRTPGRPGIAVTPDSIRRGGRRACRARLRRGEREGRCRG